MKWGIERSRLVSRMAELPACGHLIGRQYDNFLRVKYDVNCVGDATPPGAPPARFAVM
jgi:hypothetical protein